MDCSIVKSVFTCIASVCFYADSWSCDQTLLLCKNPSAFERKRERQSNDVSSFLQVSRFSNENTVQQEWSNCTI